MVNLEIRDKAAEGTSARFKLELAPNNSRMSNLITAAYPFADPKQMKLFFKIKSSDSEKLAAAFENFLSSVMYLYAEDSKYEDISGILRTINLKIGKTGENVIVTINPEEIEPLQGLVEGVDSISPLIKDSKMQFLTEVSTGCTLKNLLQHVESW